MKKRIALIVLVVIVATLAAVPLIARPHSRAHGVGGGDGFGMHILGHLGKMREKLDLTDTQVDELKGIFRETREQNQPYREQMKGGLHDVATALLADPNDTAAAQAILDRHSAAERAMKQNVLAATAKALRVLTPEQRTKLAQLIGEHRARRNRR